MFILSVVMIVKVPIYVKFVQCNLFFSLSINFNKAFNSKCKNIFFSMGMRAKGDFYCAPF